MKINILIIVLILLLYLINSIKSITNSNNDNDYILKKNILLNQFNKKPNIDNINQYQQEEKLIKNKQNNNLDNNQNNIDNNINPICDVCLNCNPFYTSIINISINENSTDLSKGQDYILLNNNQNKILCIKNISFTYDPYINIENQGSIYLNIFLKSNGPSRSLISVVNPLCNPFNNVNFLEYNYGGGSCNSCTNNKGIGCQIYPQDQLILKVLLFNQPFINMNSIISVSKIKI